MRELRTQGSPPRNGETAAVSKVGDDLPACITSDPGWLLIEEGFSPAREDEIESLFTTSNGHVGTRGSLAEGSAFSSPLTLMNGVFGVPVAPDAIPELAPVPDWTHLRIIVAGHALTVEDQGSLMHRRALDMRHGILWREWRDCDSAGRITHLHFLRLASLSDRHVLFQSVTITPENYSNRLRLQSRFPHPAPDASLVQVSEPALVPAQSSSTADIFVAEFRARGTGKVIFLACNNQFGDTQGRPCVPKFRIGHDFTLLQWDLRVEIGKTYRFDRLVYASTSREVPQPAETAVTRLEQIRAELGVKKIISAHTRAWAERWQSADVQIEGDPEAQRALRFSVYHLISAANPDDEHASVGARGLTGESYKGHFFWDTEIFLLPFYIFTHPATARSLLMYRYHTLPAAREKARTLGYQGALFAWESADDGRETTPSSVVAPDGTVVRILSGEQEHHISADVAYAVWDYWQGSGDNEFLFTAGAEVLLETARFWASRTHVSPDGKYHIAQVIGPDEYHEAVDDNAYTNVMAQWNLERGAEIARLLEDRWPTRWRELHKRVQLVPTEPEQWLAIADNMYTGFDSRTGLFEQFRGYFDLEYIDLAAYEPRTAAMDVLLGHERVQRSQVIKQADVVMLLALLWNRFPAQVREANFRYYEARTGHGSSLSPAVHALVAARLGDTRLAERYFREAASIDLANNMGNAAGGVHMANLGALWQAALLGFAGIRLRPDGLIFAPHIPESWQFLHFSVRWRGGELLVALNGESRSLDVHLRGKESMSVAVEDGAPVTLAPGQSYSFKWKNTSVGL
jgi:trehalose/maltose hydrolase-like predicted phosphorylase